MVISVFDIMFTFIIIGLLITVVNLAHSTIKMVRQTHVGYNRLRGLQLEQNARMNDLYSKSIVQIDLLNDNIQKFQLVCLKDASSKCKRCKDCPYGRSAK